MFVLLEDVITYKLESLFELNEIRASCPFRITRDSDLEIDEEADDLLSEIVKSIKRRKRGKLSAWNCSSAAIRRQKSS